MAKSNVPRMGAVVKPSVKVTPRLSAPVMGTRMNRNGCDDMGRMGKMAGTAK